ncbi:MAG: hypothetical protein V8T36_02975 [Ruthenibacterium lactatiformans]
MPLVENSHASPGLLKQANSSALHKVLREKARLPARSLLQQRA